MKNMIEPLTIFVCMVGFIFSLAIAFTEEFSDWRKAFVDFFREYLGINTPLDKAKKEYAKKLDDYTIEYIKLGVHPDEARHLAITKSEAELEKIAEVDEYLKAFLTQKKAKPKPGPFSAGLGRY
jgi:hypothetical protein